MSNVLLIGSGGREHALGWKLEQSQHITNVFYAPGNGGTGHSEKGENLDLTIQSSLDFPACFAVLQEKDIDLVVVGPEKPLELGLVDALHQSGFDAVIGPSKAASLLETNKAFTYELLEELSIPQATSILCSTEEEVLHAIDVIDSGKGVVFKFCGLAGGKGTSVFHSKEDARREVPNFFQRFGADILVCERLSGPEFSLFALCDGEQAFVIPGAFQDHKRLLDEDVGPNTGGMGAYGPVDFLSKQDISTLQEHVFSPVIQAMKAKGTPFIGVLYGGFMQTEEGTKVLEFNVRFGDPECQPLMMLLEGDLFLLFQQLLEGSLEADSLSLKQESAICVVLAAKGYPNHPEKGVMIQGLDNPEKLQDVEIFHAGTKRENNQLLSYGGRVLGVTSTAKQLQVASRNVYDFLKQFPPSYNFHYRKDIANHALKGNSCSNNP